MYAPIVPHNSQYYPESARIAGSVNCVHGSESVRSLIVEVRALGVLLSIDSDGRLAFDAPVDVMTNQRIGRLRANRDSILALVERIEERAAIVEHDGRMSRADAERLAWSEIIRPDPVLKTVGLKSIGPLSMGIKPEPVLMPEGVHCPHCRSQSFNDDPRGCRCVDCGRLAWLTMANGSIVRADFEKRVFHSFPGER